MRALFGHCRQPNNSIASVPCFHRSRRGTSSGLCSCWAAAQPFNRAARLMHKSRAAPACREQNSATAFLHAHTDRESIHVCSELEHCKSAHSCMLKQRPGSWLFRVGVRDPKRHGNIFQQFCPMSNKQGGIGNVAELHRTSKKGDFATPHLGGRQFSFAASLRLLLWSQVLKRSGQHHCAGNKHQSNVDGMRCKQHAAFARKKAKYLTSDA